MRIGGGSIGGKAHGLVKAAAALYRHVAPESHPGLNVGIPITTVLATDLFDAFMERNSLYKIALSGASDDRIALAFQKADLPVEYLGDLRALVEQTAGQPLAVRSSSLFEDDLTHPFAGIYETKMIPNNDADPNARFRHLVEAVKFVYASTFFSPATSYLRAIDARPEDEKMAVIVQEVVGTRRGERFYPNVSGVFRSYSYYRGGAAKPEEGIVYLALGLGKAIVDGGASWPYSPAHPKARPPVTIGELMKNTQLRFWAVNMGKLAAYDPTRETEYLVEAGLEEADYDNTLRFVASTYDASRDRLVPGVGVDGPRILDFSPLLDLRLWPLNDLIARLMDALQKSAGTAVEVEFAMTMPPDPDEPARFAFLQMRPMMTPKEQIDLPENVEETGNILLASERVMGNGLVDSIRDIVYVRPDRFDSKLTQRIASELDIMNRKLQDASRPYLLIGFGRWGSSDPWLGIPVNWGQIAGAKVIVESTLEGMNVELSQGAHFFHNISSFGVSYFAAHHKSIPGIDWEWLSRQRLVDETDLVRHVELEEPLLVKVDGRTGRGAIWTRAGSTP